MPAAPTTPLAALARNVPGRKYRTVREYMRPLKSQRYRRIVLTRYKETVDFDGRFNDVRRHALWEALSYAIEVCEGCHGPATGASNRTVLQMQAISCKLEDDISGPYLDEHSRLCGKSLDIHTRRRLFTATRPVSNAARAAA